MDPLRSAGEIDAAIDGTPRGRFLLELCSNSAVFPVANVLLELLLSGGAGYFLEIDFYAICAAAVAQAAWLARGPEVPWRRLAGNLCGPALYTLIEVAIEGTRFFAAPHHLAYWGFAAAIGVLQAARSASGHGRVADALRIAETVTRSMILMAMYAIYETLTTPASATPRPFFADPSHVFIAWAIGLLGLVSAVAAVTSQRYLVLLHALSRRLRVYSEWHFGRALFEEAMADPERLALRRCDRAILFLDIRGFTSWSEPQKPEAVVALLNDCYARAERVFARHPPVRYKFTADEVMAVYADPGVALASARLLARELAEGLGPIGLAAGIGLHWGTVVEGLMGGTQIKSFDVIGDTVNTAKRIEGAAAGGEILLSREFCVAARIAPRVARWMDAKGKSGRLAVHVDQGAPDTRAAQPGGGNPLDTDQAPKRPRTSTLIS